MLKTKEFDNILSLDIYSMNKITIKSQYGKILRFTELLFFLFQNVVEIFVEWNLYDVELPRFHHFSLPFQ